MVKHIDHNQPFRSTQPFILPGSINEYRQHVGSKGVRITSVGWQVTLCDPIMTSGLTSALEVC